MKNYFKLEPQSGQRCAEFQRKVLLIACFFASLSNNALANDEVVMAPILGLLTGEKWENLCVEEKAEAVRRPVDLIFVIDNSGTMSQEINSLENAINTDLYLPLQASGLDNQVVMVTNHGSDLLDVCVGPPLSGTTNCAGAPVSVANQFYHYDVDVQSHDALCILLDTMYGSNSGGEADEWGIYPDGWITALRQEALKIIVPMTDDGISCTWNSSTYNDENTVVGGQAVAIAWDQDLLALAPSQFGSQADRNYVMHSFVALEEKNPSEPYAWFENVTTAECTPGAVDPGTGYQWLAKGTKGLRFPSCNTSNYASYMNAIVDDTVSKATNQCQYRVPQLQGQTVDPMNIRLVFSPTIGDPVTFLPVADEQTCGVSTSGFYISGDVMYLCTNTCPVVTGDAAETIQVEALCN